MPDLADPLNVAGLFDIEQRQHDFAWQFFREGIEICPLYSEGETGAAAALLRYAPGAKVPAHMHPDYEHIIVLAGMQKDARGEYRKGSLLISPPGTSHDVQSPEGCIVLAIWAKPVQFLNKA